MKNNIVDLMLVNNKNKLNNLIRRPIGGFAYIIANEGDRIAGIDDVISLKMRLNPLKRTSIKNH